MDVTASLTLFGGPRAIYRQVCTTLGRLGFTARIAMAPTAAGAWLLATGAPDRRRRVLKLGSLAARLDTLPCASLPAAYPYLDWLDGIGCTTLAAIRRLPRPGLRRRSEEHTSELQSLMRISYAVFCLKKKKCESLYIVTSH